MKGPSVISQLISIMLLPFMVLVVIPAIIYFASKEITFEPISELSSDLRYGIAGLFMVVGFPLFIKSIHLFIKIGKGTIASWDPTKKLVVIGLYRHMRNPMITGVICILIAESLFYPSILILLWALIFFLINHFYFLLKEEPDLLKRFGKEYLEYKENVPRWMPRIRGWEAENTLK